MEYSYLPQKFRIILYIGILFVLCALGSLFANSALIVYFGSKFHAKNPSITIGNTSLVMGFTFFGY